MEYDQLPIPDAVLAPEVDLLTISSTCKIVDMMQLGDILKNRVEVYIKRGGANIPPTTLGLSSTSPTEFLGVYGLAEAVLYALRIYHFIISSSSIASNEDISASTARLESFIGTIQKGWASDPLARLLPLEGIAFLREASVAARAAVGLPADDVMVANTCPATGEPRPPISALSTQLGLLRHPDAQPIILPPADRAETFPTVILRSGAKMPLLGLGTWQLSGQDAEDAVYMAIQLGFRHIDCAEAYGNEANVGAAIRRAIDEGIVRREDLFIATKISSEHSGGTMRTPLLVESQLKQLRVDYIDLYYLHSPMQQLAMQSETWTALEKLMAKGVIKNLAVSNFDTHNLGFFNDSSFKVTVLPSVMQNKHDIYHHGKQLDNQGDDSFNTARKMGIVPLAYSPFSAYPFSLVPTLDPVVTHIAQNLRPIPLIIAAQVLPADALSEVYDFTIGAIPITPAMVILKWGIQQGIAQIPRSSNKQRLMENLLAASKAMVDLSEAEMELLSGLHYLTSSPLCVAV